MHWSHLVQDSRGTLSRYLELLVAFSFLVLVSVHPINYTVFVSLDSQLCHLTSGRHFGSWSSLKPGNSFQAVNLGNQMAHFLCIPLSGIIILCSLRFSVWKQVLHIFYCLLFCLFVCFSLSHKSSSYSILTGRRPQMCLFWFNLFLFSASEINLTCVCVTLIGNDIKITSRRIWNEKS